MARQVTRSRRAHGQLEQEIESFRRGFTRLYEEGWGALKGAYPVIDRLAGARANVLTHFCLRGYFQFRKLPAGDTE